MLTVNQIWHTQWRRCREVAYVICRDPIFGDGIDKFWVQCVVHVSNVEVLYPQATDKVRLVLRGLKEA